MMQTSHTLSQAFKSSAPNFPSTTHTAPGLAQQQRVAWTPILNSQPRSGQSTDSNTTPASPTSILNRSGKRENLKRKAPFFRDISVLEARLHQLISERNRLHRQKIVGPHAVIEKEAEELNDALLNFDWFLESAKDEKEAEILKELIDLLKEGEPELLKDVKSFAEARAWLKEHRSFLIHEIKTAEIRRNLMTEMIRVHPEKLRGIDAEIHHIVSQLKEVDNGRYFGLRMKVNELDRRSKALESQREAYAFEYERLERNGRIDRFNTAGKTFTLTGEKRWEMDVSEPISKNEQKRVAVRKREIENELEQIETTLTQLYVERMQIQQEMTRIRNGSNPHNEQFRSRSLN